MLPSIFQNFCRQQTPDIDRKTAKLRQIGATNLIAMSDSNLDSYIVGRIQMIRFWDTICLVISLIMSIFYSNLVF